MLSLQTVFPDTLELLKSLMNHPLLNEMRLVGGTSLALQYGHRRSVDLDFFGITTENIDELNVAMHQCAEKPQPMPFMFQPIEWSNIKQEIRNQVDSYNKRHL